MTTKPVEVVCSLGYRERSFKDREAAQRWIDEFERMRKKEPKMCPGEHSIKEEEEASGCPGDVVQTQA